MRIATNLEVAGWLVPDAARAPRRDLPRRDLHLGHHRHGPVLPAAAPGHRPAPPRSSGSPGSRGRRIEAGLCYGRAPHEGAVSRRARPRRCSCASAGCATMRDSRRHRPGRASRRSTSSPPRRAGCSSRTRASATCAASPSTSGSRRTRSRRRSTTLIRGKSAIIAPPEIVAKYGPPPGGGKISPRQGVPYQPASRRGRRPATGAGRRPPAPALAPAPGTPTAARRRPAAPAPELPSAATSSSSTPRVSSSTSPPPTACGPAPCVSLRRDRMPIVHPVTGEELGELDEEVATAAWSSCATSSPWPRSSRSRPAPRSRSGPRRPQVASPRGHSHPRTGPQGAGGRAGRRRPAPRSRRRSARELRLAGGPDPGDGRVHRGRRRQAAAAHAPAAGGPAGRVPRPALRCGWPASSSSCTRPPSSTTTWSIRPRCGAAGPRPTPSGATTPPCWSATTSTRSRSPCSCGTTTARSWRRWPGRRSP